MSKFYYGVRSGRKPGIYDTWAQCQEEVKGFKGASYKKFKTREEAEDFIAGNEVQKQSDERLESVEDLNDNEIIAYVDGSFSLEDMAYSYGLVLINKNGEERLKGRDDNKELAEMRNVAGELMGAIVAMEEAIKLGASLLYLHYDYAGIEEWALGRWKTNKRGTKKYKEFYDSIKEKLDVKFIKVAAHTGVKYNEEADKLAKEALL